MTHTLALAALLALALPLPADAMGGLRLGRSLAVSGQEPQWTPRRLTLDGWYDASRSETITLNGATISAIGDLSAAARPMSQATAGMQPVYVAPVGGLRGAMYFDGARTIGSTSYGAQTQSWVALVVGTKAALGDYRVVGALAASPRSLWRVGALGNTYLNAGSDGCTLPNGTLAIDTRYPVFGQFDGTHVSMRLEVGASVSLAPTPGNLGRAENVLGGYLAIPDTVMDIYEVVFGHNVLTAAQRNQIKRYLAVKHAATGW